MKRSIILLIVGCFVLSIATVVILFAMSGIMKDTRGSFLREFPPHPAMEADSFNIRYNSYYLAGATKNNIYLGNYTAPLHLLVLNMALTDTQFVTLKIKDIQREKIKSSRIKVDSPYFYLMDGAVPVLFKGNVNDWQGKRYLFDSTFYRNLVPLNQGSFWIKSLSGSTGENILGKVTAWKPYRVFKNDILQKQLDGVFCTDGMMHYDEGSNKLVYLYYYRNEFMVMDTSMNLLYRGNTIDTTYRAKIRPATIESENSMTLSSPPYFVNKRSVVSDNWLFVNSNLLARNEHQKAFDSGSVIDVYDLTTGDYAFSFYIYHFKGVKKMSEFLVSGNKMVVRYGDVIRIWDLVPSYFNHANKEANESL